jgi:nucleoside-diphosphate-sugar epimerase
MHVIIGAGGSVANALTQQLIEAGESVKLVSRKPVTAFPSATWQYGDLLNKDQVLNAMKGASVVYMCAGLKYETKVWENQWPLIMQHLIDGARTSNARLIFFDNVYMYGLVHGAMKEDTPYLPVSKKGQVRAMIANQLMEAAGKGLIRATIARAADFYGATSLNSFYDSQVLAKYAKKQKAQWLGNTATKHSFTYIPDAGRGMYLLGAHPEYDSQIWHMPTAPALTGKEFLEMAAAVMETKPSFMRINHFMVKAIGIFNKQIGEIAEMYYQYQYDYIFDSGKFEKAFGMLPTPYEEGIRQFSAILQRES